MIYTDKNGLTFETKRFNKVDYSSLVEMYDLFQPKGKFQGMPPEKKWSRETWINMLLDSGENILAWQNREVIGHVVILPDFKKQDSEYLIFVLQRHQKKGIGKKLTQEAISCAKTLQLKTIWLTVNAYNFKATKLYTSCGFKFQNKYSSLSERMMTYSCETNHDA